MDYLREMDQNENRSISSASYQINPNRRQEKEPLCSWNNTTTLLMPNSVRILLTEKQKPYIRSYIYDGSH